MCKEKIFALYKGEEFIDIGTAKELAKNRKVKPEFIRYLSTPANKRRIANRKNNNKPSKALINVKMDNEFLEEV